MMVCSVRGGLLLVGAAWDRLVLGESQLILVAYPGTLNPSCNTYINVPARPVQCVSWGYVVIVGGSAMRLSEKGQFVSPDGTTPFKLLPLITIRHINSEKFKRSSDFENGN
jgi:hypothetical protein